MSKRTPEYSFGDQFTALVIKSATNQIRQYGTNLCQLLFPVVLLVILFLLQLLVTDLYQDLVGKTSQEVNSPTLDFRYFVSGQEGLQCPEAVMLQPLFTSSIAFSTYGEDLGEYAGIDPLIQSFLEYPATYVNPYENVDAEGFLGQLFQMPEGATFLDISAALSDLYTLKAIDNFRFLSYCFNSSFILDPLLEMYEDKAGIDAAIYGGWGKEEYLAAFDFKEADSTTLSYSIGIYSNFTITSGNDLALWANKLASAIWRNSINSTGDLIFAGTKGFPRPESINDFDLISLIGTQIYIFIFQLLFPVILTNIVYEKETKLREIMNMMGLKSGIYWLVTYFFNLLLYLLALALIYIIAFALNLRIFTVNDFGTHFLLFFIWGNCMVAMSIFSSVFFTKSLTATVLGYIVVFGGGILATNLVDDFIDNEGTSPLIISLLSIYPPFSLYRGLKGLANGVTFGGQGMRFSEIGEKYYELEQVYYFLIIEWAVLLVVGLYFEYVLPIGPGVKKSPLFCFPNCNEKSQPIDTFKERHDVKKERTSAESLTNKSAVKILNLRKKYGDFVAVQNLSMTIKDKECFGFLGPNGAGKSTTINMLCGYLRPSSGTAIINGSDLLNDIEDIHLSLGVCPQEDVLWGDLTGPEHMYFYGRLKGLKGLELDTQVVYWLEQVNLIEAKNKLSSQYSGGMKRRLCVAIALIGDPSVVLLDEPTTGLDPASKRSLWDVINLKKKDCSILLTTHSMEEAEALCDRLGIFIAGRLATLGPPSDLKRRYGKGFKLTFTTKEKSTQAARKFFRTNLEDSVPMGKPIAGTQSFAIPRGSSSIAEIFNLVDQNKDHFNILDWGISNSTLEDIFLYIVDQSEKNESMESFSIDDDV